MKTRLMIAILFAAAIGRSALAAPAMWTIDPNHTAAHFTVRHLMISNVRGEFGNIHGTIVVDDQDPSRTTVEATLDATTVNTRVTARDNDLKSANFFDVAKYPTITFKSTKVTSSGATTFTVDGDLTMHGVTKPVTLQVEVTPAVKDPRGNERRGAQATTKLSRKAFGVSGTPTMVGDQVQIEIDVEAIYKTEAAAPAAK